MENEPDEPSNTHLTLTIRIPKPNRRWLRVSLRTLLMVVVMATMILGLWGRRVHERMEQAEYITKVYNVASLVPKPGMATADYSILIAEVRAIEPHSWGNSRGSIMAFPTNLSIVVTQQQAVHDKISRLLEEQQNLNQSLNAAH